ncbi:MAG: hypothetical protein R3A80_08115 [Bdellovibrionota bacterium]
MKACSVKVFAENWRIIYFGFFTKLLGSAAKLRSLETKLSSSVQLMEELKLCSTESL